MLLIPFLKKCTVVIGFAHQLALLKNFLDVLCCTEKYVLISIESIDAELGEHAVLNAAGTFHPMSFNIISSEHIATQTQGCKPDEEKIELKEVLAAISPLNYEPGKRVMCLLPVETHFGSLFSLFYPISNGSTVIIFQHKEKQRYSFLIIYIFSF